MKLTQLLTLVLLSTLCNVTIAKTSQMTQNIRIATFNVSMEALNYIQSQKGQAPKVTGNELLGALKSQQQQIKNIAEIIQRVAPDIILLNEFDFTDDNHQALQLFIDDYLNVSQNNQEPIKFPHFYQGNVNTGVKTPFDLNQDQQLTQPADTYGFGYFPGHFGMVLLSKYPLDHDNIRTFQMFKWKDMPDALRPVDPNTKQSWYTEEAWQGLRLSSKSHWDIPVKINDQVIHVLASHPTPPVFDGPEDRNGKRNYDEIRFWHDYISSNASGYIYDDNNKTGGLKDDSPFVILGDLNASATEGDAINTGILALLEHQSVQDPLPISQGGQQHSDNNPLAKHHTAYWRMRADYVLPSKQGFNILSSGVFWPSVDSAEYKLIENRQASSDHRLVWVDVELKQQTNK